MSFGPPWNLLFLFASGRRIGNINENRAAEENRCRRDKSSRRSFMFCGLAANGKLFRRNTAAPVPFTSIFKTGRPPDFLWDSGGPDWRNMTKWKVALGNGKALMEPCVKLLWPKNAWAPIPPIGGKNGRKRSVLTDGRGVPLSIVGSAANVNDVVLLVPTLDGIVLPRPKPTKSHRQNLCADAGYKGRPAMEAVVRRKYKPHVKQRREEAESKRTQPGFKARRWVVERTHSWMNRFRKLLVSFEKTEASYIALLCLGAATICWRQTIIIYG